MTRILLGCSVPEWEEYPHTPAVFVRVASKGLRGYGTWKSVRRMEGWGERDRAMGKIKKAGRPHSSNFRPKNSMKYPMCQLLFWLAFEWIRKALKGRMLRV